MYKLKHILFFPIIVLVLSCSFMSSSERSTKINPFTKGKSALAFCQSADMNTDYCILIDYSIHSGKQRLFIYNFKTNAIADSALVSHGCANNPWGRDDSKTFPTFSNTDGSHQSSLGKFKIGKRGYSNWGIHVNYKLHGLNETNNNAYKRLIVLHSWEEVSDKAIYPNGTPEGWGCPAVSNSFMSKLDKKLKASKKPVLMWIYN